MITMSDDTASSGSQTEKSYTLLRKGGINQRMNARGSMAATIEETFVTVEQLLDAIEDDDPLTDRDGIGPKTAEVIMDWYANREEREEKASEATTRRTSNTSMRITFHQSWEDALGGNDA